MFSVRFVPRYYKRDKLGAVVSQSVKRRVENLCEMAVSLGVIQLEQLVSCGIFASREGRKQKTLLGCVTRKRLVKT
jgi:hypothetical protein